MTKTNKTRSALFTSIISLLLCVSMLVGTTFAWFTDSVVSGNNVIAAGNLDIELYNDGNKVTSSTNLFENVLWEPGVAIYENFTIKNEGNLALLYDFAINWGDYNTLAGQYNLTQILKVAMVDGHVSGNREAVIAKGEGKWAALDTWSFSGEMTKKGDTKDFALIIYWEPSDNDNNWNVQNGKTLDKGDHLYVNLGINLQATQKMHESDSFGPDYDGLASDWDGSVGEVPAEQEGVITITTGAELAAFAKAVNGGNSFSGKTVVLGADIDLDNKAWTPIGQTGATQFAGTFDGNGKTIYNLNIDNTANTSEYGAAGLFGWVEQHSGSNSIKNLTINGVTINSHRYSGAVAGWINIPVTNCTVKNVTVNCSFYNDDTDGTKVGALVGYADNGSALTGNTVDTAVLNAYGDVGGLAGIAQTTVSVDGNTVKTVEINYNSDAKSVPGEIVSTRVAPVMGTNTATDVTIKHVIATQADFVAAINAGKTEIVLGAGNFTLPSVKGKDITLIGAGTDTIVDYSHMGGYQEVSGSSFVFKNMTVVNAETGYPYPGLQHITSVSYEDCHIVGTVNLFAPATFTNCTFDSKSAEHNVVTYGSDSVTFTKCKFTYGDRAVNCYAENASSRDVNVTFTDCTFTKVAGKDTTGAIETNSSYMNSLTLTINNCSVNEGKLWFVSGWDSLSGAKTNVTVNGSQEKGVVLVQSGVLPYLAINSNATYMLTGDFGNQNVSLVMPVGVENVTFDGSKATGINELIITQNGQLIDNANDIVGNRSGKVTVQNFNVLSQINVFACKTEVVVQKNTAEALMIHAGNCDVKVLNNTIDANFESHPTYRDANNTWNTNNYGIALNIFDYNLWLDGNTVTDATSHAIGINGWEGTFDIGEENVIESFKGNTITVNSTTNTKRAAFKVWDDETYASNDDDTNVVNAAAQAFINAVLADGSNTFNIVDGYDHTIFSFYNVNTNN